MNWPGVVAHAFKPSTQKAEIGLSVQSQLCLYSETLSQKIEGKSMNFIQNHWELSCNICIYHAVFKLHMCHLPPVNYEFCNGRDMSCQSVSAIESRYMCSSFADEQAFFMEWKLLWLGVALFLDLIILVLIVDWLRDFTLYSLS